MALLGKSEVKYEPCSRTPKSVIIREKPEVDITRKKRDSTRLLVLNIPKNGPCGKQDLKREQTLSKHIPFWSRP